MKRRAFTIIELLVVISIIALLISILLPSLAGARDRARFIKWAGYSHGMRADVDNSIMYNFENQSESATFLRNQAAGDPFEQAKYDMEPQMNDAWLGKDETTSNDPTWVNSVSAGTRWNGKGALLFEAPGVGDNYCYSKGDTFIGDTPITVFGWVRYKSYQNWSRIIDWGNGANVDNLLIGNPGTTQGLGLRARPLTNNPTNSGAGEDWDHGNGFLDADNKWAHFAVMVDNSDNGAGFESRLYVNGVLLREEAAKYRSNNNCLILA